MVNKNCVVDKLTLIFVILRSLWIIIAKSSKGKINKETVALIDKDEKFVKNCTRSCFKRWHKM